MSVQKHRLERGWSQEQLAQHSGLSVRTIQRIEKGKKASLETLKCLAAAFDTTIADLIREPEMPNTDVSADPLAAAQEKDAVEYVKNLKGLYINIIIFAVVVPCLAVFNYIVSPEHYWVIYVAVPWALALLLIAMITFGFFNLLGPRWEQRQFKKRMER